MRGGAGKCLWGAVPFLAGAVSAWGEVVSGESAVFSLDVPVVPGGVAWPLWLLLLLVAVAVVVILLRRTWGRKGK